TKAVAVTAVVTGTPGDGFSVSGTTISPAVATVTGESTDLAAVTSVQTQPVTINGATSAVSAVVGLDLRQGISAVGNQAFTVQISLRPNESSRTFSAGLVLVGAESDRAYTIATDSVLVTLGGGEQALAGVDAAAFSATLTVTGLGAGAHDVTVRLTTPAGLKLLSVS